MLKIGILPMHVERWLLTNQSVVQCRTELHSASVLHSKPCYFTEGADMHDKAKYRSTNKKKTNIYLLI